MKTAPQPLALAGFARSRFLQPALRVVQGLALVTIITGCVGPHPVVGPEARHYRQGLRQDIRHERQEDRRERQDFLRETW